MKNIKFFNKTLTYPIFLSLLITNSCMKNYKTESEYCASRYPVILVHGIAFRDKTFFFKYWGEIPSLLKKDGAIIFTGNQQAYGSIEANAKQLKMRVEEILKTTGSEKVNIIAHSRGGLEARFMISILGMDKKVASLTTLATPHRGSIMADYIIKNIHDRNIIIGVLDFYAKIIGDDSPESLNAGIELTTDKMNEFNNTVNDSKQVYYQSYACAIDSNFFNPLWRKMFDIIAEKEGINDGLVSVNSAKWGRFRGVVSCNVKPLVTHSDIVGMHILSGENCFDEVDFFRNIVHELKTSGY